MARVEIQASFVPTSLAAHRMTHPLVTASVASGKIVVVALTVDLRR